MCAGARLVSFDRPGASAERQKNSRTAVSCLPYRVSAAAAAATAAATTAAAIVVAGAAAVDCFSRTAAAAAAAAPAVPEAIDGNLIGEKRSLEIEQLLLHYWPKSRTAKTRSSGNLRPAVEDG